MIMKGKVNQWKNRIMMKRMGCGTSCMGTIISYAWLYRPKKSVPSAYGISSICDISGSTALYTEL